jgi:hypothetical protein
MKDSHFRFKCKYLDIKISFIENHSNTYCETQANLNLNKGECCISSLDIGYTLYGSVVYARAPDTEFKLSFETRFPKSGNNYNYCVLRSLTPTQLNRSVLNGFNEIVLKEGWNSSLISCQTGGILRIDPKSYAIDSNLTENFILGDNSMLVNSKLYGSFNAKFVKVGNGEAVYRWIQYFPADKLTFNNFPDIFALLITIFTTMMVIYSLAFFVLRYIQTSKLMYIFYSFSQTIWLGAIISYIYLAYGNYSGIAIGINAAILNFALLCSAMNTVSF